MPNDTNGREEKMLAYKQSQGKPSMLAPAAKVAGKKPAAGKKRKAAVLDGKDACTCFFRPSVVVPGIKILEPCGLCIDLDNECCKRLTSAAGYDLGFDEDSGLAGAIADCVLCDTRCVSLLGMTLPRGLLNDMLSVAPSVGESLDTAHLRCLRVSLDLLPAAGAKAKTRLCRARFNEDCIERLSRHWSEMKARKPLVDVLKRF